jgi:uncharacterized protein (TIGR00730 family)
MPKARDIPTGAVDAADSWRVFRIMSEFVEGFEILAPIHRAVTMFGSARTKPDDPMYQAAEQTARLLAKANFAVITGGGPGIMEAANKGCFEAGGISAGLNISLPHEQESNRYQTISLDFHYFYARKVMFVKYATAFICFPGGYGTLDEFFETLTLIQTMKIEPFPILLYGSHYWRGLVEWIRATLDPHFVDNEDLDIVRLVDSPQEAAGERRPGTTNTRPPCRRPRRQHRRRHALRQAPAQNRKEARASIPQTAAIVRQLLLREKNGIFLRRSVIIVKVRLNYNSREAGYGLRSWSNPSTRVSS